MDSQGMVVVTGASRGIGAATALELARRGFRVGCLSRGGQAPEGSGDEPADVRRRLLAHACDVTDEQAVTAALGWLAGQGGPLAGLVNNAGIHREEKARSLSAQAFRDVLEANTVSAFVMAREIQPYLVQAGGGLIVNIGSFFGRLGVKGSLAYCASKAALAAMTRCLAAEWGGKGIAVLDVAPGYVETDVNREYLNDSANRQAVSARIFTRRPGRAEEVACLVAALFTERIGFLTGQTLYIDGGQSVAL